MQSLVTARRARPQVDPAFARLLERRVLAPARAVDEELAVVAVTEPPRPVQVLYPPHGGTWIAALHGTDPVALARGATYAPPREIRRMKQMRRAGVDPDLVLILHELAGHWRQGDPVPDAYAPGARATVGRVVATQAGMFEVGRTLLRAAAGATERAARGIGAATVGAAAGLAEVVALDPVVLGGVRCPDTGLVAWVKLASWHEEPA